MADIDALKRLVSDHAHALVAGAAPKDHFAPDAALHLVHPFNEGQGPAHFQSAIYTVRGAFGGVERRDQILVGLSLIHI